MGGIYIYNFNGLMEEGYNLDRYFDYYMDTEMLNRNVKSMGVVEIPREIPNFKCKISRYREMWRKCAAKSIRHMNRQFSISSSNPQFFTIPYYLYGNCTYQLSINVEELKGIAKEIDLLEEDDNRLNKYFRDKDYIGESGSLRELELKSNGIKINLPSDRVKQILDINISNINKEYAKTRINAKDPILCLDMTDIKASQPPFCIVDGNHQTYGKLYIDNRDNIELYMISRNLWIKCLSSECDKMFVKIFNNINSMVKYMGGLLTEEELNNSLYNLY